MLARTGKIGKVDSTYSIKGKGLQEGTVFIRFYVEKELPMLDGDKLIVANQLKATVGAVVNTMITKSGMDIGLKFGKKSVEDRIVLSPEIQGTTNLLLDEMTRLIVETYDS